MTASVAPLLVGHRPGWSLARGFYLDPGIAEAERARIWHRRWLFAAHGCELPEPGCFVTLDVAGEPVVVLRDRARGVRAFANVCRHRGSRVCTSPSGRAHRLVCPYHAWTYDLDGRLCSDTREYGVEPGAHGLRAHHAIELGGLVFVSLAEAPPPLDGMDEAFARWFAPQGLAGARVARSVDYRVAANWKVVFENNRECLHCPGSHPEYIRANYDIHLADSRRVPEIEARVAEEGRRWQAMGLEVPTLVSDMTAAWWRVNRTPLAPGFLTESLDGAPVAPVMGSYAEHDVGTLRATMFANFWMHGSGDHAVTTRLLPDGTGHTLVRVAWLVDARAEEGRDFDPARLMPFWQRTSEQDWEICENVQRGISSAHYRPGPFARQRERNVAQFVDWYLGEMAGA